MDETFQNLQLKNLDKNLSDVEKVKFRLLNPDLNFKFHLDGIYTDNQLSRLEDRFATVWRNNNKIPVSIYDLFYLS